MIPEVCPTCGWRHEPEAPCQKVKWRPPGITVDAPAKAGNPAFQPVTIPCVCPECGLSYEGASHKPLEEGETHRPRRCEHCRGGDKAPPPEHVTPQPKAKVVELQRPVRSRSFYEREEE